LFADSILRAGTVFWNGPMGVFELSPYADGTRTVTQALTDSSAFTVVGGGDTGVAIRVLGFPDSAFGRVSTGAARAWSSSMARPCLGWPCRPSRDQGRVRAYLSPGCRGWTADR
jgi:hypothetical protein